jgi:2,5-diketo-D-gluconate reductase A
MTAPIPLAPRLSLSDGASIPQLGFGLYKVPATDASRLCRDAIAIGYRHLDTAAFYGNEREVGESVRTAPVPREELFVTSKVWKDDNGFDETLRAFDASMTRLGLDALDLYLIHWPVPSTDRYVDTWRALIRLREERRVRSIGVANFHTHHLERIIGETGVTPVVNQVELHPWLPQTAVREFDAARGIRTEAWSPLARGRVLGTPLLDDLAAKHDRTPAQVVLRWHVQLGNIVIPKASSPERLAENLDVFGFELDADDVAALATLETGERTGRDPDVD